MEMSRISDWIAVRRLLLLWQRWRSKLDVNPGSAPGTGSLIRVHKSGSWRQSRAALMVKGGVAWILPPSSTASRRLFHISEVGLSHHNLDQLI